MGQQPRRQYYTRTTFGKMPTGTRFRSTPTATAYEWLKVSTRTARVNGNGASYYFRMDDTLYVEIGHWAEMLGDSLTGDDDAWTEKT